MTDKKASEAKGPYFEKEDYSVHSMNTAYAEGFKAGRSSRDEAIKILDDVNYIFTNIWALDREKFTKEFLPRIKKALEADGEGK